MNRLSAFVLGTVSALAFALLASSCSKEEPPSRPGAETQMGINEVKYTLQDGRTVTCLIWSVGSRGGMSCDWYQAGLG